MRLGRAEKKHVRSLQKPTRHKLITFKKARAARSVGQSHSRMRDGRVRRPGFRHLPAGRPKDVRVLSALYRHQASRSEGR